MSVALELQALIDALRADNLGVPREVIPGEVLSRAVPVGWQVAQTDAEYLLDGPRRSVADVKVRSAQGFIDAVQQRWPMDLETADKDNTVVLYADDAEQALVAILNDDTGFRAGWRDHRITLGVRKSEEWVHWTGNQGLTDQEKFAGVIDKGALEITDPSPAQMLRIAESFEATVGIAFKKGARVRDGAQQYTYEESIDATAGGGTIAVPDGFTITVAPFIGSPRYTVKAALRTRLVSGKFTIGYALERPHEVERAAFRDIVRLVGEGLELTAIEGVAPSRR